MFSFDRSGAGVTGTGLGAGVCAYTPSQLARRMASKAKVNRIFFMVADLLEVRACRAFTIQTPLPRLSFEFIHDQQSQSSGAGSFAEGEQHEASLLEGCVIVWGAAGDGCDCGTVSAVGFEFSGGD